MKISTNKGMRGVRTRYDAVLLPNISILRHPGRPVISGMDTRVFRALGPKCPGSVPESGLRKRGVRRSLPRSVPGALRAPCSGESKKYPKTLWGHSIYCISASPKPHPSKPQPCNMRQAKTEVVLQFSECCAAEVALQHSLFCSADVIFTKSCAAASEKLHCDIGKLRCRKVALSRAFLRIFRLPRLRSHV